MKLQRLLLFSLLAASCALQSAPAWSAYIVDTGINESHDTTDWALNGNQGLAAEFHVGQSYTISAIEGLISTGPIPQDVVISLYSDAGDLPGGMLYTASAPLVSNSEFPLHPNWQGVTGLNWQIDAGSYWVVFKSGLGGFSVMPGPTPNQLLNEAFYTGGWGANDDLGIGVRIEASVVPLPGAAYLFASAVGVLLILTKRRAVSS